MFYRYNKVITEPLAKMGAPNAQYKMGIYWFSVGEMEIPKEDLEKAIYWWEKAAAKGHDTAIKALAYANKVLEESNKEEQSNTQILDYIRIDYNTDVSLLKPQIKNYIAKHQVTPTPKGNLSFVKDYIGKSANMVLTFLLNCLAYFSTPISLRIS